MDLVKWCLCIYLFIFRFSHVFGINNYDQYRNLISEEERRGALENYDNLKASDNVKREIYLASKYKNPASLIVPAIRVGYDVKEAEHAQAFEHKPAYYPTLGARTGYGYFGHQQPVEYGTGLAHLPGGAYSHTGLGAYGGGDQIAHEYPVGGYEHTTGVGYGGGAKNFYGLKKFLLPLAGIAILGAAAALTANPVLLQLGAITTGKRRRRGAHLEELLKNVYPTNRLVKPDTIIRKLRNKL